MLSANPCLNSNDSNCRQTVLAQYLKVNVMCPGWVRTRMGGEDADRSPEQAAETAIWLATLDNDGPTGQFFRNKRQIDW